MKHVMLLLALIFALCMTSALAEVQAYPVPEGTPTEDAPFAVTANGQEVGVYGDYNGEFYEIGFAYFNFDPGETVEVKVKVDFPFKQVEVLPANAGIVPQVDGDTLTLTVDDPGQDLSFVFDGDYQGYTLHLFTNEIDHEAEKYKGKFGVIYYGPGYHDESHKQIVLGSGMTLYVDAGAVVNAPVVVYNAKNVKILGTGMIMMDKKNAVDPTYGNINLCINNSQNVYIGDIIAHAHRTQNWTTHIYFSKDVTVEGYHVVSPQYASTDAIDISNSQNVTIKDVFLRSCDDCITVKGLGQGATPDDCPPNENIHVSDSQLWNDCNNAMVIGEESMAAYYNDISFRNIDVLYSYDDRDNHERLDERAAMSIVLLHGTEVTNITWEDIRVNNCQRLVCFRFVDSFWFGSIQGNQSFPGYVDGVTLRNITCESNNTGKIANDILIYGWSKDKKIQNVTLENFVVNGKKLNSMMNPYMKVNSYIKNIQFE